MYISHEHKCAFFRVPKTGSTTMMFMLCLTEPNETDVITPQRLYGWDGQNIHADARINPTLHHMTPQDALENGYLTDEQIADYDLYCTLRDPFDRYISALCHADKMMDYRKMDDYVSRVPEWPRAMLSRRQSEYFYVDGVQVATPLDFRKYKEETQRIVQRFGGPLFPVIPRLNPGNSREKGVDYWSKENRAIIGERFKDDIELYNEHYKDK
jgi:hypothetical protein